MSETLETLKAYQLACAFRKEAFRIRTTSAELSTCAKQPVR